MNENKGIGKTELLGITLWLVGSTTFMIGDIPRTRLHHELQSKIERIADTNSNGLSVEEISRIYENLNLNPVCELKIRGGLNLGTKEMQQYLRNTGNFNPGTDTYKWGDNFKQLFYP